VNATIIAKRSEAQNAASLSVAIRLDHPPLKSSGDVQTASNIKPKLIGR